MAFRRSLHVILQRLCLFRLTYPRRKKLFRRRNKKFHRGKQHILTCRAMLKYLSRGSEQPENRGDLGKNRRNGGMFSKM